MFRMNFVAMPTLSTISTRLCRKWRLAILGKFYRRLLVLFRMLLWRKLVPREIIGGFLEEEICLRMGPGKHQGKFIRRLIMLIVSLSIKHLLVLGLKLFSRKIKPNLALGLRRQKQHLRSSKK